MPEQKMIMTEEMIRFDLQWQKFNAAFRATRSDKKELPIQEVVLRSCKECVFKINENLGYCQLDPEKREMEMEFNDHPPKYCMLQDKALLIKLDKAQ